MKNVLLVSTALIAGVVGAQAVDLPPAYKAPASPAAAPAWAGFYIGGSAGYGWGEDNSIGNGRVGPDILGAEIADTNAPGNGAMRGWLFGGRIGYDLQVSPLVIGLESDIHWTHETASGGAGVTFPAGTGVSVNWNAKNDWWGSTNARLGYEVGRNTLVYGLGGIAYGNRSLSTTGTAITLIGNGQTTSSLSDTAFGWDAGIGLSTMLDRNWELFSEYRHVDLGTMTSNVNSTLVTTNIPTAFGATQSFKFDTVTAGVNYRF